MSEEKTITVYRERAHLVALLARLFPSWFGVDEKEPEWPVIYIMLGDTQVSWHIAHEDLDLFEGIPIDDDKKWDGHSTEEKYQRIREYMNKQPLLYEQPAITNGRVPIPLQYIKNIQIDAALCSDLDEYCAKVCEKAHSLHVRVATVRPHVDVNTLENPKQDTMIFALTGETSKDVTDMVAFMHVLYHNSMKKE